MTAWPLGPSPTDTKAVSTPLSRRISVRTVPSPPIFPAWLTAPPARAAAMDWFSPLPPQWTVRLVELSVSPACTK